MKQEIKDTKHVMAESGSAWKLPPHDEPFDVPNLDGLPDDELSTFVSKYWYANGTRGKLKDYAWQIKMARECRLDGKVDIALHAEQLADRIYQELPNWAKW